MSVMAGYGVIASCDALSVPAFVWRVLIDAAAVWWLCLTVVTVREVFFTGRQRRQVRRSPNREVGR